MNLRRSDWVGSCCSPDESTNVDTLLVPVDDSFSSIVSPAAIGRGCSERPNVLPSVHVFTTICACHCHRHCNCNCNFLSSFTHQVQYGEKPRLSSPWSHLPAKHPARLQHKHASLPMCYGGNSSSRPPPLAPPSACYSSSTCCTSTAPSTMRQRDTRLLSV